jgi:hypothetical protein
VVNVKHANKRNRPTPLRALNRSSSPTPLLRILPPQMYPAKLLL